MQTNIISMEDKQSIHLLCWVQYISSLQLFSSSSSSVNQFFLTFSGSIEMEHCTKMG